MASKEKEVPDKIKQKILAAKSTGRKNKQAGFAIILADKDQANSFRKILREIKAQDLEILLFDNATDDLSEIVVPAEYILPDELKIKALFEELEKKYRFFNDNQEALKQFSVLFLFCKLIADFFEKNNDDQNKVAALHAYKILVLFGFNEKGNPFRQVEDYLLAHQGYQATHPIHDILVTDLPVNQPQLAKEIKDLTGWRAFIFKFGRKAIQYFQQAAAIEKELNRAPQSLKEAKEAKAKFSYLRYKEYPELADLCREYDLSEENFNRCLDIRTNRKSTDHLPNVCIHGTEIDHPNYAFVKLPLDDPRAYILGHITKCCQSIGSHAEKCVIDGITREHNGFYVLLKRKKASNIKCIPVQEGKINYEDFSIVGQGYAWISKWGNLTFDSWENLRPAVDDGIAVAMLQAFAKRAADSSDILRVTIGQGGKTPKVFQGKDQKTNFPEQIKEGHQYGDSKTQALIYFNESKREKIIADLLTPENLTGLLLFWDDEEELRKLICVDEIFSQKQINQLRCLLLQPNSVRLWEELLGADKARLPLFKNAIVASGRLIWDALSLLQENDLLSAKNFNAIISAKYKKPIEMADSLIKLHKAEILTDKNRAAIIEAKSVSWMTLQLIDLHKANILDDKTRNALANSKQPDGFNLHTMSEALIKLHQAGILDDNLEVLVEAKHPYFTSSSLVTLHKAGIVINDHHRAAVVVDTSSDMTNALIRLHQEGIVVNANHVTMFLNKDKQDYSVTHKNGYLIYLHKEGIEIDDENLVFLMTGKSGIGHMAYVLRSLHKERLILDDKTRDILVDSNNPQVKLQDLIKQGALIRKIDKENSASCLIDDLLRNLGKITPMQSGHVHTGLKNISAILKGNSKNKWEAIQLECKKRDQKTISRFSFFIGHARDPKVDLLYRAIAEIVDNLKFSPDIKSLDELMLVQQKRDAIAIFIKEINRLEPQSTRSKTAHNYLSNYSNAKIDAYKTLIDRIRQSKKQESVLDIIQSNLKTPVLVHEKEHKGKGYRSTETNRVMTIGKTLNAKRFYSLFAPDSQKILDETMKNLQLSSGALLKQGIL